MCVYTLSIIIFMYIYMYVYICIYIYIVMYLVLETVCLFLGTPSVPFGMPYRMVSMAFTMLSEPTHAHVTHTIIDVDMS